jgi:hypothetical protein
MNKISYFGKTSADIEFVGFSFFFFLAEYLSKGAGRQGQEALYWIVHTVFLFEVSGEFLSYM